MGKEPRSFRLDEEVLNDIRYLSERWHVSQVQVLEMLVREAIREGKELQISKSS